MGLCTNLGAANNYKDDHVKKPEMWKIVEDAKIVYSAGFFITVSPEAIEAVSNQTAKSGAIYCLNLSAPFIVQVPPFRACLEKTLPNCDFLFGNETEALAYAVVAVNGNVTLHPINKLDASKIVDTNGAGDAFVGGFLAALSKGKSVADCCKAGNFSASIIIQHSGCTYPAKPEYAF